MVAGSKQLIHMAGSNSSEWTSYFQVLGHVSQTGVSCVSEGVIRSRS
jgi:hypothetical protein